MLLAGHTQRVRSVGAGHTQRLGVPLTGHKGLRVGRVVGALVTRKGLRVGRGSWAHTKVKCATGWSHTKAYLSGQSCAKG